ncbi:MAG: hypothetical protein WD851_24440 [Pirellulales bacterium]
MPTFEFQVVLADVDVMTDEIADEIYAAGCDDGSPFSSAGVAAIGFSREAPTIEEAVRSAIAGVNKAGFGVARVEFADEPVFMKINLELARS